MKIRRTIPAVLAALACALSVAVQSAQTPAREPLTVMSFNIRYGTANDGDNHWTLRREFLFDVMREVWSCKPGAIAKTEHRLHHGRRPRLR